MSHSFVAKEVLKPVLSQLLESKVFDAGYEVCSGIRIAFYPNLHNSRMDMPLEIDLFDESSVPVLGVFGIEYNSEEIFNKIKSTIIDFSSNKQTYTMICEDGIRTLIDCGIDASILLKEANDIILSTPSQNLTKCPETGEIIKIGFDAFYEDHFEISYFSADLPSGNSFFIKK